MFDRAPGLRALGPRPARPLSLLVFATLTMGPLAVGGAAQQSPEDQPCVECHSPESIGMTRRWIHAPLRNGSCATCHDPHGSTAPHVKARGAAACLGCHDRSRFQRKTIHAVLASKGCRACHDAHASDIKGLLSAPEGKLCTGCHEPDAAFAKAHGGGPLRTCTKCHDPHSSERPKLLRASLHEPVAQGRCDACHAPEAPGAAIAIAGAGRCAGCHDAAALDGGGPVRHAPVRTGGCLSCHDAHASDNPKLTRARGDALCGTCHRAQVRKPQHPHAPMQAGCRSCHAPHNARSKKLLAGTAATLCRSCHPAAGAPGRGKRVHLPVAAGECASCHDPHGSDAPAMLKGRQDHVCFACHADAQVRFSRRYTHAPVSQGSCTACHAGHAATSKGLLKASGAALCRGCHPLPADGQPHRPFAADQCLECHDPHGSDVPGMLREPQKSTCLKCHERERPDAPGTASVHAPFADGDCTSCHSPHQSRLGKLLRAAAPDLCFPCHKAVQEKMSAARLHPPGRDCLGCHQPHRAKHRRLLSAAARDSCVRCHDATAAPWPRAHLGIDAADAGCTSCHDAHASKDRGLLKQDLHPPFAARECDACHTGAGAADGTRIAANPRKLRPGASGEVCLGCHRVFAERLKRAFVHGPVKSARCVACHDPHVVGKRLAADVGAACTTCHAEVVPQAAKSTHRPAAEGRCVDCHDPHASPFEFNLVRGGDDLCANCHPKISGASGPAFRHRQACITCHDPHGSAVAPALLKTDVPALCAACHPTGGAEFVSRHAGYPVSTACTTCHDPHGSRTRGMLHDRIHAPVAAGKCATCHDAPTSSAPFAVRERGGDLCNGCHLHMLTATFARSRIHQPVVEGACLACHPPHGSRERGLSQGGMNATCRPCHRDTMDRPRLPGVEHPPVREGRCTACHEPHASDTPLLLRTASSSDMCRACHTTEKHKHQPGGSKDPRNPNLRLECLSCHRAHGTGYDRLLPYARKEQLCAGCHGRRG